MTCAACLDARHHRCRGCGCTVCTTVTRTPRKRDTRKGRGGTPKPYKPRPPRAAPTWRTEALDMRLRGMSDTQIAEALGLHLNTVRRGLAKADTRTHTTEVHT